MDLKICNKAKHTKIKNANNRKFMETCVRIGIHRNIAYLENADCNTTRTFMNDGRKIETLIAITNSNKDCAEIKHKYKNLNVVKKDLDVYLRTNMHKALYADFCGHLSTKKNKHAVQQFIADIRNNFVLALTFHLARSSYKRDFPTKESKYLGADECEIRIKQDMKTLFGNKKFKLTYSKRYLNDKNHYLFMIYTS